MDKLDGPWSKNTILEPKSGKTYNKYFYKRQPAHRVEIDTGMATALAGYALIEKDLRSAIHWLGTIQSMLSDNRKFVESMEHVKATDDREKFNLVKALFVAALTFYGKCFSQCEGRRIKLEVSNLDEEFREEHKQAMLFRNNFAAHSGKVRLEHSKVVLALDKKRKASPYMVRELTQPDTCSNADLTSFIKLFEHGKRFADKKIEILARKVYEEDVLSKGADHWYAKV